MFGGANGAAGPVFWIPESCTGRECDILSAWNTKRKTVVITKEYHDKMWVIRVTGVGHPNWHIDYVIRALSSSCNVKGIWKFYIFLFICYCLDMWHDGWMQRGWYDTPYKLQWWPEPVSRSGRDGNKQFNEHQTVTEVSEKSRPHFGVYMTSV